MKKTLFAAAVMAAASINAFGIACNDGAINGQSLNLYATTNGGACTIGNGGTLWNISNFAVFNNTANGINIADMQASTLNATFNEIGANGFSVTYTTPGNTLFTYAPTPTPAQANSWANGMWISGLQGSSVTDDIIGIGAAYGGGTGNVNFSFRKVIQTQQGGPVDSSLLVSYGTPNPTNFQQINGNYGSALSVNDRVVFDSGGTNGGSISSYTNYFYGDTPQTGVPEPMSFVLMGAGLVGIAALRRRSS
jgi:hypothetical protein